MGRSLGEGMSPSKSSSSLAYAKPPYSESESDGGEGGRAAGIGSGLSEGGCCALNFSKNGSRGVVGVVIGTAGNGTLGGSRGGGTWRSRWEAFDKPLDKRGPGDVATRGAGPGLVGVVGCVRD